MAQKTQKGRMCQFPTYETRSQKRLLERVERLSKVLEMNAPKIIIVAECALVAEAALGFLGPELLVKIGQDMIKNTRLRVGYCHGCGALREEGYSVLCKKCQESAKDDAQKYTKLLGHKGKQS